MASELQGAAALTRRLRELGELEKGKPLREAVRDGIKPAYNVARSRAPEGSVLHKTYKGRLVAPGFLRRSVKMVVRQSKDKKAAFAFLGVAREAFYGTLFVELGTSKMAARPWLIPAFESMTSQALEAIRSRLAKAVAKAAKTR